MAYDNQTAENKQKFMETCTDSLIFVGGDDGGILYTPKSYVNDLANGYSQKPHHRAFQLYDNTAIVTSFHQAWKLLAKDTLLINVRSTKVFVKENEKWKMAYVTFAPLPVLYFKSQVSKNADFSRYAGIYDAGNSTVDSIFVENGKIYSDVAHSGKSELTPINDSTFLGDGYFGKIIFKEKYYEFEFSDGQRIKFDRIR